MLRRLIAVSFLLALSASAAGAADQQSNITGLFVTTKYPALTVTAGETTTVDVSVRNFKLPPQVLQLGMAETAPGWKATILGGGQPIAAVGVAPDSEERLQVRLEPPAGRRKGRLPLHAAGQERAARREAADHADDRRRGPGQAQAHHQHPGAARHLDHLVQVSRSRSTTTAAATPPWR